MSHPETEQPQKVVTIEEADSARKGLTEATNKFLQGEYPWETYRGYELAYEGIIDAYEFPNTPHPLKIRP